MIFKIGIFTFLMVPYLASAEARAFSDYAPVLKHVLEDALPINPETGIYVREINHGVHVVSDGIWQSAFVVTEDGVVVIDAPESYAPKIRQAIAKVTDQPIKMLIYSHAHKDHIGGSAAIGDIENLEVIALEGVAHFLKEKQDPNHLVPTVTFKNKTTIRLGGKTIELAQQRIVRAAVTPRLRHFRLELADARCHPAQLG